MTGTKADNPRTANIVARKYLAAGVLKLGCMVKISQPMADEVA